MGKGKGGSNTTGGNPNQAQPEVCLPDFFIILCKLKELWMSNFKTKNS